MTTEPTGNMREPDVTPHVAPYISGLPNMSECCVRVLETLGPDLPPSEWAAKLEVDLIDVIEVLERSKLVASLLR